MVELKLDRPRTLKYRWSDLRELCRRLGGLSLVQFSDRLSQADPETVSTALLIGLRHEDKRLTGEKIDDMIQAFFDSGGRVAELMNAVSEALVESGGGRASGGEGGKSDRP